MKRGHQTVWVTYEPGPDCLCWMDAVCPHEWTWREDSECRHQDHINEDVHASLADAVRNLFQERGAAAVGHLLRDRYASSPKTMTVYVMPPSAEPWGCDHAATVDTYPSPYRIIERKDLQPRSRPGDGFREFQDYYRDTSIVAQIVAQSTESDAVTHE